MDLVMFFHQIQKENKADKFSVIYMNNFVNITYEQFATENVLVVLYDKYVFGFSYFICIVKLKYNLNKKSVTT